MSTETHNVMPTALTPMRYTAFMDIVTPKLAYAAIMNHAALPTSAVFQWIWAYVNAKYLQPANKVSHQKFGALHEVFDSASVDMFEITKLVFMGA